jgi:hypothetical protein
MKVYLDFNRKVEVAVKPVLIEEIPSNNIFKVITDSVLEGGVSKRLDGIYIDSDVEIISVAAPSDLKQKIKEEAEQQRMTMEDLVIRILKNHYGLGTNEE